MGLDNIESMSEDDVAQFISIKLIKFETSPEKIDQFEYIYLTVLEFVRVHQASEDMFVGQHKILKKEFTDLLLGRLADEPYITYSLSHKYLIYRFFKKL